MGQGDPDGQAECTGQRLERHPAAQQWRTHQRLDRQTLDPVDQPGGLGAGVKVSYAADWTEYFGHHPQDGSGDVYFDVRSWPTYGALTKQRIDDSGNTCQAVPTPGWAGQPSAGSPV